MRIIAGKAKGIPLKAVPGSSTRPTTDKVKESVFNMIGPFFDGGLALDLYAGSGGLGIEALSRGCDAAVFTDRDRKAVDTIRFNLEKSRLAERAEVYKSDAGQAIRVMAKKGVQARLLFLDPPYRDVKAYSLMDKAAEAGVLSTGALVVCEHEKEVGLPDETPFFVRIRKEVYGSIAISIYRRKEEESNE